MTIDTFYCFLLKRLRLPCPVGVNLSADVQGRRQWKLNLRYYVLEFLFLGNEKIVSVFASRNKQENNRLQMIIYFNYTKHLKTT